MSTLLLMSKRQASTSRERLSVKSLQCLSSTAQSLLKRETLINPRKSIESWAEKLHGICDRDVAEAPEFSHIRKELENSLRDRIVIAHRASFDIGRLRRVMKFFQFSTILDSCTLAHNKSLASLIEKYSLSRKISSTYGNWNRMRLHGAGYDAHATAHLFVELVNEKWPSGVILDKIAKSCEYKPRIIK